LNGFDSRAMAWLAWALPFALIAALIGWETDWGRSLTRAPVLASNVAPQPVSIALLPEYRIEGGLAERRETVERTLFNPTRRPAPPQAAAVARAAFQRGQFVLTGTTVVDQKATAFLREVNGGRARRVQKGETINGMLVAEVRPDRVRFTLGDESEELTLKVAAGPRMTVQPVVAAAPAPGTPGAPVAGATPGAPGAQQAGVQDVSEVLANRRRAARAAQAAANAAAQAAGGAATGGSPVPRPPAQPTQAVPAPQAQQQAPTQTPQAADPAWNELYQRYMQPRR
jgi:hypothetical protein